MSNKKEDNILFIKDYGLFWKRDDVWWGKRGNQQKAEFKGELPDQPNAELVELHKEIGFYMLYNINSIDGIPYHSDELVYCGFSGRDDNQERALFHRIKQHQQPSKPLYKKWNYFSWFSIATLQGNGRLNRRDTEITGSRIDFLRQIEATIINISCPTNNKDRGNFVDAQKYLQPPHPYPHFRN